MSDIARRTLSIISAGRRLAPASFYVDSRDAVDDGGGLCASVTDKVGSYVFLGGQKTSGIKPILNTTFISGVQLLEYADIRSNLLYVGDLGFGRDSVAQSFVVRVYRTTNDGGAYMINSYVGGAGAPNNGGIHLQSNSTTAMRTNLDTTTTSHNQDTSATFTINNWYTWGISYNGTTCRVFRNGVFLEEFTPTGLGINKDLGIHTEMMLGNRGADTTQGANALRRYYAGWIGFAGRAISDVQHQLEHDEFASWAS